MTQLPLYRPGHPERGGGAFGLAVPRMLAVVLAVTPLVVLLATGRARAALVVVPFASLLLALVLVTVRGRSPAQWVLDATCHGVGLVTGWSSWQSSVAAGLPVDPDEADLPGMLSRLELLDGPRLPQRGRVCLLHDLAEDRWGATARLSVRGIGLSSPEEQDSLADGLGRMLRRLGDTDRVDRASLLVRIAPDDGRAHEHYRRQHQVDDAPELATSVTADLRRITGTFAVRQEAFLTVSAGDDALRRAGGAPGLEGRARALYRSLDGLSDPLRAMGVEGTSWLTGADLAEVVRTGFNPAAGGVLADRRLETGDPGLAMAAAGPSRAPSPGTRSYTHDGWTTVSWAVVPPRQGVRFGSLAPLLAIRNPGERRTLAIHYEVLPPRVAERIARRERRTATMVADLRATRGVGEAARDLHNRAVVVSQEDSVASGEAMVRYAVVVSVTVPSTSDVEAAAEAMEASAAGQYSLQRLELAQDSGFVASVLPLGLGLRRLRGTS